MKTDAAIKKIAAVNKLASTARQRAYHGISCGRGRVTVGFYCEEDSWAFYEALGNVPRNKRRKETVERRSRPNPGG